MALFLDRPQYRFIECTLSDYNEFRLQTSSVHEVTSSHAVGPRVILIPGGVEARLGELLRFTPSTNRFRLGQNSCQVDIG